MTTAKKVAAPPPRVGSAAKGAHKGTRPAVKAAPKIPTQGPTRGLSVKGPKVKDREGLIHNRLKKKSPWYQSIMDPLHGADAKIPDETGVETGTLQLVERMTVHTNDNGIGGMRILTPYINSAKNVVAQVVAGSNVQYINPSGTDTETSLDWGSTNAAGGTFTSGTAIPFEAITGIQQITNQHRIVSACLMVQPEVSLSTNQGEYCLFLNDFAVEESSDYGDYLNNYKSVAIPISSAQNSGIVRWFPVARQDWNFKAFLRTDGIQLDYDDDTATSDCPYWVLGVLFSGAPAGRFRCTVVVNYEFIPKDNVLNVLDTSPSPQDSMETDLVERWVQDAPLAAPIPTRVASSSQSSVEPSPGTNDSGTGFGMFFNVISELAPLALALL